MLTDTMFSKTKEPFFKPQTAVCCRYGLEGDMIFLKKLLMDDMLTHTHTHRYRYSKTLLVIKQGVLFFQQMFLVISHQQVSKPFI